MKKLLVIILSAIIACSCCACSDNKANDDDSWFLDTGFADYSFVDIYDYRGHSIYTNHRTADDGDEEYLRYSERKEIVLEQDKAYYLSVLLGSVAVSMSTGKRAVMFYDVPVKYNEFGELEFEPTTEYDSEYLQVTSQSNVKQCIYMIKGLKPCGETTDKTVLKIPSFDEMGYRVTDIQLSISIVDNAANQ